MAKLSILSGIARRLEGKVALITGGASGIGECTAKVFAEHGAKVVIADIQDDLGHSVREKIGTKDCTYVHCNVTNEDHIKNAVDKTVETYGKLDIMFNNAGITDAFNNRIVDNKKADFEKVIAVNVTGVFLGMKHAARVMVPARSGSIISSASIASKLGGASTHAYCCSKHAVVGLTKNLAAELGQFGIRVNCVSPYTLITPMTMNYFESQSEGLLESMVSSKANLKGVTLKRDDIAKAVLYLASDDAKYVSGLNLMVDGGCSMLNANLQIFNSPMDSN